MTNILFYNPNIRELVERIQIGPQAEVLELIEEFNDNYAGRYDKPISITKKFYYKPGAYVTIKEIMNHLQWFDRKANSLLKVIDRSRDASWSLRNLGTSVAAFENKLLQLRSDGIVMQDNTDDAVEAWNVLKHHFISQWNDLDNNISMEVLELHNNDGDLIDLKIYVKYIYKDYEIKYCHADTNRELASIHMPGKMEVIITLSVPKLINELIRAKFDVSKMNPRNIRGTHYINSHNGNHLKRNTYLIGASYNSGGFNLQHPYIARHSHYSTGDDNFKYICLGNLEKEIYACIKSLDFVSLKLFIDKLALYYNTNTGPMNRITESYYGQPTFLKDCDEYHNIVPRVSSYDCSYRGYITDMPIQFVTVDSYCAKFCNMKDTCDTYLANSKEISEEEVERKALEQATINAARRVQ